MFYGIDVEVDYPKKDVFTVGSSNIGADSIKFLTNNELYQTFAIRIISELSQQHGKDHISYLFTLLECLLVQK